MNWNKLFHNMKDGTVITALVYVFIKVVPFVQTIERFESNIKQTEKNSLTIEKMDSRVDEIEKMQIRSSSQNSELLRRMDRIEEKIDNLTEMKRSWR